MTLFLMGFCPLRKTSLEKAWVLRVRRERMLVAAFSITTNLISVVVVMGDKFKMSEEQHIYNYQISNLYNQEKHYNPHNVTGVKGLTPAGAIT